MTTNILICGLTYEMEIAKELNLIGKCKSCFYNEYTHKNNTVDCKKLKNNIKQKEDCELWLVDMR